MSLREASGRVVHLSGRGMVGVFGKLPTRGDFLLHRLTAAFADAMHGWLADGLAVARGRLGEGFANAYLAAPVWRFVLANSVAGPDAAAGILLPSVDAVGRYFPLTLAQLSPEPLDIAAALTARPWFDRLEELARRAVAEDLDPAIWLAEVDELPPQRLTLGGEPLDQSWHHFAMPDTPEAALLAPLARFGGRGLSIFWSVGSPFVEPAALVGPGLPEDRMFVRLLADELAGPGAPW